MTTPQKDRVCHQMGTNEITVFGQLKHFFLSLVFSLAKPVPNSFLQAYVEV